MSSCRAVITLALSKLGISGGSKPAREADLTLGLTTLTSLYRSLIANGSLGRSRSVVPTGDYIARPNDRILRQSAMIGEITLPDTVCDDYANRAYSYYYDDDDDCGDRVNTPLDGSFVIINDEASGQTQDWMFEAYTSRWISLFDLSLQEYQEVLDDAGNVVQIVQPSIAPLSFRDDNGLAAMLAMRLSDHYGAQVSPVTMKDAGTWLGALITGFGDRATVVRGEFY
jgi:hypothetical protein